MASNLASSPCFLAHHNLPRNVLSQKTTQTSHYGQLTIRSSASLQVSPDVKKSAANYQPTAWSYDFVHSLESIYSNKVYKDRVNMLENEVQILIEKESEVSSLALLELIDDIERLGLGYRFEKDITRALDKTVSRKGLSLRVEESLHATSLRFRLLRKHGYDVSQDMFKKFKDDCGNGFMAYLQKDVKGLLSLYEASFLAFEGESLLDEAKAFAKIHLKKNLKAHKDTTAIHVEHALELPLYCRMQRLEARWYIDIYRKKKDANQLLVELAALDFNVVQSTYQRELQIASRWWKSTGLATKLSFIRDRPMECFFWAVGVVSQPQCSTCRIGVAKVASLITAIDDVYDVYGSLDELELFTNAVERWDVDVVKYLSDELKLCYLALYNAVNELAYETLKEHGVNIIPILTKVWSDLCKAFLIEAKWNQKKGTPTLEDYLDNAWQSVSGVVILVHAYFLMSQEITKEELEAFEHCHDLLKWSSMIFRLCNDLGTSSAEIERGETANAILCYMRESGDSDEVAREKLRSLTDEAWKKMNKTSLGVDHPIFKDHHFFETAINLARIAECVYQNGDGHGAPDGRSKNRVLALIIEPIAFMEREKHAS